MKGNEVLWDIAPPSPHTHTFSSSVISNGQSIDQLYSYGNARFVI